MAPRALAALLAAGLLVRVAPALADDAIPGYHVDHGTTGTVIGVGLGVGLAASLIPIRGGALWPSEMFGEADDGVHGNFSRRASHLSDALVAAQLVAPVAYLMDSPIDDAVGDRLLVYGESLAVNVALLQVVKYSVQRPRPYLYNSSAAATAYAKTATDARLSFYSGHAALSFGAAVTGAYLLSTRTDNHAAKNLAWGLGMMAATATANLRVRAGKHFYSDVVIGAGVGMAVGYVVPALHAEGAPYTPSATELELAAGGVLLGALVSQLIPLEKLQEIQIAPVPIANGLGLSFGGTL